MRRESKPIKKYPIPHIPYKGTNPLIDIPLSVLYVNTKITLRVDNQLIDIIKGH